MFIIILFHRLNSYQQYIYRLSYLVIKNNVSSFKEFKFEITYLELFRALFVVRGSICCKASIGAEIEGSVNSAVWFVGGGAIINSELCGAEIWGAEVEADCIVVSGGAKFDGTFGILTRIARAIFQRLDEIPLAVSRVLCFNLRSPFWIRVNSLVWLSILASVDFSKFLGFRNFPILLIYSESFVLRSCLVPNFAMSLFRTVTSTLPGSRITNVCWFVLWTTEPGASTSYGPPRFFLERLYGCLF